MLGVEMPLEARVQQRSIRKLTCIEDILSGKMNAVLNVHLLLMNVSNPFKSERNPPMYLNKIKA